MLEKIVSPKDLHSFNAATAAKTILGWELIRELPHGNIKAQITETEAYDENDPASHSFKGQTLRNRAMFGPAGRAYVYFIYGCHYCFNVVVGPIGTGSAVLIRSAKILEGDNIALNNRQGKKPLSEGPGRLAEALRIDLSFNNHDLTKPPLRLIPIPHSSNWRITAASRIGISKAKDALLSFSLKTQ